MKDAYICIIFLMKIMRNSILLLFVVFLGVVSCREKITTPDRSNQTVFMYMPWTTNLTSYLEQNITDFESAVKQNILKKERVLVFFATSPQEATLFELKYENGTCVRKTYKSYNTPAYTTSGWITSVLEDVKTIAPAKRYAMIVSGHGTGWLPVSKVKIYPAVPKYHWDVEGVPLTRFFGGLAAAYQTEIPALAQGISDAGLKMEYILFDNCYMSTIEVAYDLKDVADYLIASPAEIMAYGFPYHWVAPYLVGNVDYYSICNGFYTFYQNYSTPCGTIAVTNCAEIDALAAVMKEINGQYSINTSLLNSIQPLDGYRPVIFYDFGDYVSKLCPDHNLLERFDAQLERTVPFGLRMHTPTYYTALMGGQIPIEAYSGITISDPSLNPMATAKNETAWYKATH